MGLILEKPGEHGAIAAVLAEGRRAAAAARTQFAIATVDRYLTVFEAFLDAGWAPLKLFTIALENQSDGNLCAIRHAEALNVEVQLSRIRERDLSDLRERGCDVMIVAGYKWRIGDWRPHLKHAINFHPSPLPEGRGPYPLVRALLEDRRSWAVTCHKINQHFDAGDILAQEEFPVGADDCHESLTLKIQMAAKRLAARVAENFADLWDTASPQGEGSYWKPWTADEQTMDFTRPVESVMRHARAFGLIESIARLKGMVLYVRRVVGWTEAHHYPPGTHVHTAGHTLVIAVRDGYVGLVEWSLIPQDAVAHLGRSRW